VPHPYFNIIKAKRRTTCNLPSCKELGVPICCIGHNAWFTKELHRKMLAVLLSQASRPCKRSLKETSGSLRTGTGGELKKRRFGEPAAPPIFSVEPPHWQELIARKARKARTARRNATAAKLPGGFPLRMLPEELQLIVAEHVAAPRDRAALCVAVPPLGRKLIKAIPALYKGPLMSLGNLLLSGGAVGEAEVRRYVCAFAPSEATHPPLNEYPPLTLNEYAQLNTMAAPSAKVRYVTEGNNLEWRLESGALLRCWKPYEGVRNHRRTDRAPAMHHYEGAAGAERLVSVAGPLDKGDVHDEYDFEGERGAEQRVRRRCAAGRIWHYAPPLGLVRCEDPSGVVIIYDGEPRPRCLRKEKPCGMVAYLEGEMDAEHIVRAERPNGAVLYYEGEINAEHVVRLKWPCGKVGYLEGEINAEHLVRLELPCGEVGYFEGEKGAEHLVRKELPTGEVQYFEGEKGAEHMVQKETATGEVQYFEGEEGAEYMVQKDLPCGEVAYFEGEMVRLQSSTTYANNVRSRIAR